MSLVRRPYMTACQWVADNDEPEELDEHVIVEFISVMLIADLWQKTPGEVALMVKRIRLDMIAEKAHGAGTLSDDFTVVNP